MISTRIAIVVIGRNEGERLKRCLRSLPAEVRTVYVDSGSTDDSVAFARSMGVTAIELDMRIGFTAARARNAGWRSFCGNGTEPDFVQFIDGDCELDSCWIETAATALNSETQAAVVFGRRRERFPDRSLFNRMCDEEWNVPVGIVNACGGDAMFRLDALRQADGYSDDLIAGEEPDLCLRLRRLGWHVRRIDAEMTLHDANILSTKSWWRRTQRSGYAYAAHVVRHRSASDPQWLRQVRSIAFWGGCAPLAGLLIATVLGAWFGRTASLFWLALLLCGYALQIYRIARRRQVAGSRAITAWQYGALVMFGKFAELGGMIRCAADWIGKRKSTLIEYKGPA